MINVQIFNAKSKKGGRVSISMLPVAICEKTPDKISILLFLFFFQLAQLIIIK